METEAAKAAEEAAAEEAAAKAAAEEEAAKAAAIKALEEAAAKKAAEEEAEEAYRTAQLSRVYASFDLDGDGGVSEDEMLLIGARRQLFPDQACWTLERNTELMEEIGTDAVLMPLL